MSKVPVIEGVLSEAEASLDALLERPLEVADPEQARALVRRVDRLARKVRAAQIDAVALIEDHGLHRPDGHASGRVMVGHVAHLSEPEAKRRDRARRQGQQAARLVVGQCHSALLEHQQTFRHRMQDGVVMLVHHAQLVGP